MSTVCTYPGRWAVTNESGGVSAGGVAPSTDSGPASRSGCMQAPTASVCSCTFSMIVSTWIEWAT